MSGMTRRRFTRILLGGATISVLAGCSPDQPDPTELRITPSIPPTLQPTPTAESTELADFFSVNYSSSPPVDIARWTLTIDGMVEKPAEITLADLVSLPLVSQVSRMKCVECWSTPAKWGGFRYDTLRAFVTPAPEADWVHLRCADGYYESLSIEELRMDRVLFVHRMNDAPLSAAHGAPLRMIVPFKYGYKGAKAITKITFAGEQGKGLWSAEDTFSVGGDILEGVDHPLDLKESRHISGGEIRYPDGPES